jgi:hypothetical protein
MFVPVTPENGVDELSDPRRSQQHRPLSGFRAISGRSEMKLAGLLLLVAGWGIVISAVALLPFAMARAGFVLAGMVVELLGLNLMVYSHLVLNTGKG